MSGNRTATVETDKGTITFTLHEDKAPVTTENFVGLAERGVYTGLTFHRVEPGFVIQGGCPQGTGTGSSDQRIKLEIHPDLRHDRAGTVAMARSSDADSSTAAAWRARRRSTSGRRCPSEAVGALKTSGMSHYAIWDVVS